MEYRNILPIFLLFIFCVNGQILFGNPGSSSSQNRRTSSVGGSSRNRNRPSTSSNSFNSGSSQTSFSRPNSQSGSGCRTVSGPKVGAACKFPFIFNSKTYFGCPIDPDDNSKRWCSTKTDRNNNHIGGQGEYGHCSSQCPIHNDETNAPLVSTFNSNANNNNAGGCKGGDSCRSIGACALKFTQSQINRNRCTTSSGDVGLCCPDLTSNQVRSVFPDPTPVVSSRAPISNIDLRQAVNVGTTFFSNVTNEVRRKTTQVKAGSATAKHSKFQKARPGVAELNRLALIATEASRNLNGDQVGLRQADTSNTILSNCYPNLRCSSQKRYRTIDGSCNNLRQPLFGRLLTPVQRVLENAYSDRLNRPRASRSGSSLPSARLLSRQVAGSSERLSSRFSALFMVLGQFLDHDLTHVPIHDNTEFNSLGIDCCTNDGRIDLTSPFANVECFPIRLPFNDPLNEECMNFVRSQSAPRLDCLPGPSEQINQISHWLDSSNVYGSEDEEANGLRTFRGGRLASTFSSFGKELLPNDDSNGDCRSQTDCFKAGDGRNSEQPNLAVIHTLFMREHNRIADFLQSANSNWNDERVYQEARRIVNAQWQHIIFNEYLPILLGPNFMSSFGLWPLNSGYSQDYRNDFDPRITNEFSTAAFRVGHTMIPNLIKTVAKFGGFNGENLLRNMFFNIDTLRSRGGIDSLILGLTETPMEEADDNFSEEVTNHLFDGRLNGMDLLALNIQRGRDHGLPGYVEYRRICRVGSGNVRSFDDLSGEITRDKISRLKRHYQNVEDIDLFVGMILETPGYNNALVGPTFLCLLGDQFVRLKKGDRFFYDLGGQAGSFTPQQLNEIRKTTLARIICDNSDNIKQIQPLALQLPNFQVNSVTSCGSGTIPKLNLNVFT